MNDLTGGKQEITGDKTGKAEGSKATQFVKGKSGNPNGRPREKSLTTLLKEALKKIEGSSDESYEILLVQRLLQKAINKGDMRAIQMIWERLEGKPKQSIELSGKDGEPIEYVDALKKMRMEMEATDKMWFEEEEGDDEETKEGKASAKKEHEEADDDLFDDCPSETGGTALGGEPD